MKELKKLNKGAFSVTKEAPGMVLTLVGHVEHLEDVIEQQERRIATLEDKLDVDQEFEALKAKAKELEIDFPGNIKKETLAKKIEEVEKEEEDQKE